MWCIYVWYKYIYIYMYTYITYIYVIDCNYDHLHPVYPSIWWWAARTDRARAQWGAGLQGPQCCIASPAPWVSSRRSAQNPWSTRGVCFFCGMNRFQIFGEFVFFEICGDCVFNLILIVWFLRVQWKKKALLLEVSDMDLVGGFTHSEKYYIVNWDDYSQYL